MHKKEDTLKIVLSILVVFILISIINPDLTGFFIISNKAQNPSFEKDKDKDGIPNYWRLHNEYTNDNIIREITTDEKYKGSKSFKIQIKESLEEDEIPENQKFGLESRQLSVKPETRYRLKLFIKTEDIQGNFFTEGGDFFTDVECNSDIRIIEKENTISGTNDWTFLKIKFRSKQATKCKIIASFEENSKGTAYIDSVRFLEIAEEVCGDGICSKDEDCPEDCTLNLLINPSAEEGLIGWTFHGESGVTSIETENSAFYTEDMYENRAHILQDVQLPTFSQGKYLLSIGYTLVEYVVEGSITRHPYLYGYQMNNSKGIIDRMKGQQMRHTTDANTWQVVSGIFPIHKDAKSIRLFLQQAYNVNDPPDGTRAMFDDIELRIFNTQEEAEHYRDIYQLNHIKHPKSPKTDFCSLGSMPSQEEEKEIIWNDPYFIHDWKRQLGSKDEDHRTIYGIIMKNPKSNSASDQVVLEIPNDQVKANIVIKDKLNNEITKPTPINKGIAYSNSFNPILEDQQLPGLLDKEIYFNKAHYDIREVILLRTTSPVPETSLTSMSAVEDDYEGRVYLEMQKDSIGYYYAFDEAINVSKATFDEPLEIEILGKKFKIIDASDPNENQFIAIVDSEEHFMNVGDSVIIAGTAVTLENVGTSGSVIVSVDNKLETIPYKTDKTVEGIGIFVLETYYESNKEQRSATLIMKQGDIFNTFKDGSPFYGGDEVCRNNDPDDLDCWEWDIANLASNKATEIPDNADAADIIGKNCDSSRYCNGTIIGIQTDFSINDDTDNPPGVGECIDLPNDYISICFDSLTVSDTDYATYTFEIEKATDLSDAGNNFQTQTSEPTIFIHTDINNGLILKSNNILEGIPEDKTTKRIWLSLNNKNNDLIDIFYEDENNKIQYAGYTTEIENTNLIQINYLDTTSNNININSIKKENQNYFLTLSIKGDNPDELESETLQLMFNTCQIN